MIAANIERHPRDSLGLADGDIAARTPGGAMDVLARIIGPRLSAKWGQPVVIENRAGVGGIIGTGYVAHSPPDGNTLLIVTTGFVTNPFLYSRVPPYIFTD